MAKKNLKKAKTFSHFYRFLAIFFDFSTVFTNFSDFANFYTFFYDSTNFLIGFFSISQSFNFVRHFSPNCLIIFSKNFPIFIYFFFGFSTVFADFPDFVDF